jgi:hypothetical protein
VLFEDERFFAALGMTRQCAVGKATAACVINDVDNTTWGAERQSSDTDAEHGDRVGPHLRAGRRNVKPGTVVHLPVEQITCRRSQVDRSRQRC